MEPTNVDGFSPNQIVPREIWSIIFALCLPSTLSVEDLVGPGTDRLTDTRLTPISLASVCSSWRNIACSTPELWATCWLSFSHPELNEAWLGRAGMLMLHLYGQVANNVPDWGSLFRSILPFQERWETLTLRIAAGDGVNNIIPKFERTGLKVIKIYSGGQHTWLPVLLSSSPQIHTLALTIWPDIWPEIVEGVTRFSSLTTLNIRNIVPMQVISLLSIMPQLQHLDVSVCRYTTVPDLPRIVTHTNLLTLRLHSDSLANTRPLFLFLLLPSLYGLYLRSTIYLFDFINLIRGSGARLTELSIREGPMPEEALGYVYWLERLEFIGRTDPLTPEICAYLKDTRNVPHLKQLLLHRHTFENTPLNDVIADMIIERSKPRTCGCKECSAGEHPREVRLEYVLVSGLEKGRCILNTAQLVPLPEDQVENRQEATMVIKLIFVTKKVRFGGDIVCRDLQPVQFFIGNSHSESWH